MPKDPVAKVTGQLKAFGTAVLIWSILCAVLTTLFGLNTVVGMVMQPRAQVDPSVNPSYQAGYMATQVVMYTVAGISILWTVALAIIGLRLGPALGRLEPVRRWGLVWCAANLVVCPFGTGVGIWGLVLLTRPEAIAVLEGGAGVPAGLDP